MIVSETVKPLPHPFYGDNWERGKDPWHVDAAPDEVKSSAAWNRGERANGWFLLDAWGNAIGFIPDGAQRCKWCYDGPPEWSRWAKVWIHRRDRLDRQCEDPPNDYGYTTQVPEETISREKALGHYRPLPTGE